ncbi:MAG: hypothetical protein HFF38_04525 [Lawsonibacter sp.]|nr:hypothetical protein [Lawsonibacter sp.]
MDVNLRSAVNFGELLRKNPQASAFYDNCTQEQRNAILLQVGQTNSAAQLKALIDNLPSTAL